MSTALRRIVPVLAAVGMAAVTAVTAATPAQALIIPEWPTTSYAPTGCTITGSAPDSSGLFTISYSDPLQPTVVDTAVNRTSSVVLKPGAATPYTVNVTASETCSGVGYLAVAWVRVATGTYQAMTMTPLTTDVFTGTFGGVNSAPADEAGAYRVGVAAVGRRYDSFTLDANFRLAAPPTIAGGAAFYTAGPWSLKRLYLLRQTTVTIASPVSVKKGKLATVSGVLKYATNAGYVADAGEKVLVQTRIGTAAWKTVAVVAATASGAVSAKVKLLKTSQVRFVHAAVLSGRFTAAVTSATKTIKVT